MFKKTLITLAIASIIPLQAFAVSDNVNPLSTIAEHNKSNIAGKNYARIKGAMIGRGAIIGTISKTAAKAKAAKENNGGATTNQ